MATDRSKRLFQDVRTKKRIREHLANKNDLISEEDIGNVDTEIFKEASNISKAISEKKDLSKNER